MSQSALKRSDAGHYAAVNGIDLYYEIHGEGRPLILIHGGMGGISMFAQVLPALAASRQVIGIELQAHAHTADVDRPLRLETMADDVAALIRHLGLDTVDIAGYSLGGGVALQTAFRLSDVVRRLVVISFPFRRSGWFPDVRTNMDTITSAHAAEMVGSPPHDAYMRVAPRPEDWPVLVGKMGDLMRQDYDWSAEVAALPMPVLIMAADADGIQPEHTVEMFHLLGGGLKDAGWDGSGQPASRLAVLPGTTHYDIVDQADLLIPMITAFLDAE